MVLLACYAPGEQRPAVERRTFWDALRAAPAQGAIRRRLVVAGDLNSHPGADRPNEQHGGEGLPQWKGCLFYTFCAVDSPEG